MYEKLPCVTYPGSFPRGYYSCCSCLCPLGSLYPHVYVPFGLLLCTQAAAGLVLDFVVVVLTLTVLPCYTVCTALVHYIPVLSCCALCFVTRCRARMIYYGWVRHFLSLPPFMPLYLCPQFPHRYVKNKKNHPSTIFYNNAILYAFHRAYISLHASNFHI